MLSPSRMPFGVVIFIGFPLLVASCVPHPDEWMGLSGWHWSRTDAVRGFRTPLWLLERDLNAFTAGGVADCD